MTILVDANRDVVYTHDDGEALAYIVDKRPDVIHIPTEPAHIIAVCKQGPPGAGGGTSTYTNPNPSVIEVGGIPAGTTFDETTFSEFVDQLLYPELFPSFVAPSATFTLSITGRREIGETIAINCNSSFDRGDISPQYDAAEPFRSGSATGVRYTGTGLVDQASLPDSQTVSNYVVLSGTQSWSAIVDYAQGPQPTGSNGTPFDSPLPAGSTTAIVRTITGVYPIFATTASISALTKQSLVNHGSRYTVDFTGEVGDGNKQVIEFPVDGWGPISTVEQWNPLTSSWDPVDLATFTLTSTNQTIQGNVVSYRRYEHNGPTIGARRMRWDD